MLTSLLPGLRELRAPLSAGALWLLALWFLVEPAVPEAREATGLVASAYRLAGPLSAVGLGAVLAFVAYLLGSLSVFVFTGRLRGLIPVSAGDGRFGLKGLSPGGEEALRQVARDGRRRLDDILSLSGSTVDDVLPAAVTAPLPSKQAPVARPMRRRRHERPLALTRETANPTAEDRQEAALASLVVRDLEVIADAQLLGRENDVFSAVDRDRAELEFRLAVVPGLVALALAAAARQPSPLVGAAVVLLGIVAAIGLMLDAARQQRTANDLLLNLLEHDRLQAPSLTRLDARAKDIADESPAALPRLAGETSVSIRALSDLLDNLARSGTATLPKAAEAALAARRSFHRLQQLLHRFGPTQAPLDASALEDLESVLTNWIRNNPTTWTTLPGAGDLLSRAPAEPLEPEEMAARLDRARAAYPALLEEMKRQVADATEPQTRLM